MMKKREGWVFRHPRGNLDLFLKKYQPSQIDRPDLFWLCVENPNAPAHHQVDEKVLHQKWQTFTKGGAAITEDSIKEFAGSVGWTKGYWTIYVKAPLVDTTWQAVAKAVVDGTLGPMVKVCTRNAAQSRRHHEYIICVYTNRYMEVENVMKVESELRQRCCIQGTMHYTPDIYPKLGIYFHNQWGIRPHPYESKQ